MCPVNGIHGGDPELLPWSRPTPHGVGVTAGPTHMLKPSAPADHPSNRAAGDPVVGLSSREQALRVAIGREGGKRKSPARAYSQNVI